MPTADSAKLVEESRLGLRAGDVLARQTKWPIMIQARVGDGVFGEVWRAVVGEKKVAVKFYAPRDAALQEPGREYFEREISLLAKVKHPNVVRFRGEGRSRFGRYYLTEWIDGRTVDRAMEKLGRPFREATRAVVFRQVCLAIDAIHQEGIGHFDLTPRNLVLAVDGTVSVIDFGHARMLAEAESMNRESANKIGGTPFYMSPEVSTGNSGNSRSDIYALGLILYWLYTGKNAFDAKLRADVFRLHRERSVDQVVENFLKVCPESVTLAPVFQRCLAKKADERYERATDLFRDFLNATER